MSLLIPESTFLVASDSVNLLSSVRSNLTFKSELADENNIIQATVIKNCSQLFSLILLLFPESIMAQLLFFHLRDTRTNLEASFMIATIAMK